MITVGGRARWATVVIRRTIVSRGAIVVVVTAWHHTPVVVAAVVTTIITTVIATIVSWTTAVVSVAVVSRFRHPDCLLTRYASHSSNRTGFVRNLKTELVT